MPNFLIKFIFKSWTLYYFKHLIIINKSFYKNKTILNLSIQCPSSAIDFEIDCALHNRRYALYIVHICIFALLTLQNIPQSPCATVASRMLYFENLQSWEEIDTVRLSREIELLLEHDSLTRKG
jgi:hypothetical protein